MPRQDESLRLRSLERRTPGRTAGRVAASTALAAKVWTVPAGTQCSISVGGSITASNGDLATFGGSARLVGGEVHGHEDYRDHGPAQPRTVRSVELTAITCADDLDSGSVFGTAAIDGSGTYVFRIDVTEGGEPGTSDTYGILLSDGYASGQQPLTGGNVQIRD